MNNSKYTKEFRAGAVQLALNSEQTALQIAADLNINSKTLYNWISEHKRVNNIKFDSRRNTQKPKAHKESIEDENRRLRAENKLLKQEREILKKAAAYFAKETL